MRAWIGCLALLVACGGTSRGPTKAPASTAHVGSCANPLEDGVLSERPDLAEAHRDLNGDGQNERVYADRTLCKGRNCQWNMFAYYEGCHRYIGTIAASSLELGAKQGEGGYRSIRGWWDLGPRQLAQEYRFREGGYELVEVLVCRQGEDDRILCASEEYTGD